MCQHTNHKGSTSVPGFSAALHGATGDPGQGAQEPRENQAGQFAEGDMSYYNLIGMPIAAAIQIGPEPSRVRLRPRRSIKVS